MRCLLYNFLRHHDASEASPFSPAPATPATGASLVEVAIVPFAAGAAELFHHHSKSKGEDVSDGLGRVARTLGAGVLGAVALQELSDHHDRGHSSH